MEPHSHRFVVQALSVRVKEKSGWYLNAMARKPSQQFCPDF
jgi:hypothetical protein